MAKTSKKTEEEMLQETFAQFQTQATTDEAATESGDSPKSSAKSNSSGKNNLILLISCVAAATIIGYVFLIKPMLNPPIVEAQNTPTVQVASNAALNQQQPPLPSLAPAPAPAPVVVALPVVVPVEQVPSPVNVIVNNPLTPEMALPEKDPIAQLQQQQGQGQLTPEVIPVQKPVVEIRTPEVDNFFNQNSQNTPTPTPTPTPTQLTVPNPVVVAVTQPSVVVAPVTALDAQQTNVVNELQSRFENQNNEFKNLISGVDGRVSGLEGKVASHNERINRLESFHVGKGTVGKTSEVNVSGNSSEIKAVEATEKVKKVVKKAKPVVKHREASSKDENVLFGSGGKKTKQKADKQSYQEYPIHSIYGGRFWLKNNDGSLSTYAPGDSLPSGEVIKEVNDENFSIKTNLRTIVKK